MQGSRLSHAPKCARPRDLVRSRQRTVDACQRLSGVEWSLSRTELARTSMLERSVRKSACSSIGPKLRTSNSRSVCHASCSPSSAPSRRNTTQWGLPTVTAVNEKVRPPTAPHDCELAISLGAPMSIVTRAPLELEGRTCAARTPESVSISIEQQQSAPAVASWCSCSCSCWWWLRQW